MGYLNQTNVNDMKKAQKFAEQYIFEPRNLPVSFVYGELQYYGFTENAMVQRKIIDSNIEQVTISDMLPYGVIANAEAYLYKDYPVVEWVVSFTNYAPQNSPLISELKSAELLLVGEGLQIETNNGDFYSEKGYTPSLHTLDNGETLSLAPNGGRPCNGAFPYQRVLGKDGGTLISIGWPGQWSCEYMGCPDGVIFSAGQEVVHTVLEQGETLRTPRMTLMFYEGDRARGINLWRRWINAHVVPKRKGYRTPVSVSCSDFGGGIEFTLANEKNQLDGIKYCKEQNIGANMWWIDAGWYPCKNSEGKPDWTLTGSWYADPERFPNGLKPVSDACHDAGLNLLVWFEPERVRPGFQLANEHPEWTLSKKEYGENEVHDMMLNLGNEDCRKWLSEYMANFLKDNGIDWYRQDFNFEPKQFWRDNEDENRKGMCENKYIQGYLAYWDYILQNVPDIMIDSCASGGRRNDLETLRRSIPLHPTDYGYGYHHINQGFRHALYSWITYVRAWSDAWDIDNEYYSHEDYYAPDIPRIDNFKMTSGAGVYSGFVNVPTMKACSDMIPYVAKMTKICKRFGQLAYDGDFYPLTKDHRDSTKWTVFQFDLPESKCGVIQALRNNQAKESEQLLFPKGFENEGVYVFENPETGESFEASSKDILENGITLKLPEVRTGGFWFYNLK